MAEEPVSNYYRKAYQDFTGGLSTRANALLIPANEESQLDNCVVNDTDILEKAPGNVLDGSPFPNSADSFIRMLINYKVGLSINTLVCAAQDDGNTNATYKVDLKQTYGNGVYNYIGYTIGTVTVNNGSPTVTGSTTKWVENLKAGDKFGVGTLPTVWYEILSVNSDTSLTLTTNYGETNTSASAYMTRIILNKANIPNAAVFNGHLIIVNGSETPMTFDNTNLSKLQSPNIQEANFVLNHKNRVFMLNWPGNSSSIMWSATYDETTWNLASVAPIFPQDNGNIVNGCSFANSLLLFKDNGVIYQVIGEFDQDAVGQPAMIRKLDVPDNLGVIAGRSVCVNDDNKLYFLCETGVYTIDTRLFIEKVSWDISPNIANLSFVSTTTATKNFPFTAQSQWDTGTLSALSDKRALNGLSTFFDKLSIPAADQDTMVTAVAMDSTNNVHVAWLSSDNSTINYTRWLATDNSTITQTVVVPNTFIASGHTVTNYSLAISIAANGNVGVASISGDTFGGPNGNGIGRSFILFSELVSGAWSTTQIYTTPQSPGALNAFFGNLAQPSNNGSGRGITLYYTSGNDPRIMSTTAAQQVLTNDFIEGGAQFLYRISGVWASSIFQSGQTGSGSDVARYTDCDVHLDGSGNIHVAFAGRHSSDYVEYAKSVNGGLAWTFPLSSSSLAATAIFPTGTTPTLGNGKVQIGLDENANIILIYNFTNGTGGDVGNIVRYNVTPHTPVKTTVATGTTVSGTYFPIFLKGYTNSGTGEIYYCSTPVGTTYREQYIFDITYIVGTASFTAGSKDVVGTNTKWTTWVQSGDLIKLGSDDVSDYGTVNTVNSDTDISLVANYAGTTASGVYNSKRQANVIDSGASAIVNSIRANKTSVQGNLVASVAFGVNANEIVVRRTTVYGKWTSPVLSDNTLTAWGTYAVTSPVTNGNLVVYEIGLNTTSTITGTETNLIVPGSIISTNDANIFAQAVITFVLENFAAASVGTLVLNYVGIGASAVLPTAYVFNNEMYLSVAQKGQTANNTMLFLDRMHSWGNWTQSMSAFARYNQQLYAGSSLNGNIYKIRQGYNQSGNPYSMVAVTKEDLLGSIELTKDINKIYVIYKTQLNGSFTFSYRLDNFKNAGNASWVDTVIDQTQNGYSEILVGQTASSVQFKIEQDDKDVQVGIIGFIILYGYLNLR